jgi:hypothetical protein
LYDFNNEFRNDQNDHQLISNQISQIKDVAYSKELEQEIHDDENMNCDTFFPQVRCPSFFFVPPFNFFVFID